MDEKQFFYGGQAVIEGVMIRGRRYFSLAVRRINGDITTLSQPIGQIYTGKFRSIPLLRGVLTLIETLFLGIKALNMSAAFAIKDLSPDDDNTDPSGLSAWIGISIGIVFGIGIFFILPLFAVQPFEKFLSSDTISNVIEGIVRLALLIIYISVIGLFRDIKVVFSYHGAEHMAVHTHEADCPLELDYVRKFPTAHPRCGTAFLLTVMVVAIITFAFIPRSNIALLISSRILLIPVIASISYEIIRFNGKYINNPLTNIITWPGLMLQRLTTRVPTDNQIEVAIQAMKTAIEADKASGTQSSLHPTK